MIDFEKNIENLLAKSNIDKAISLYLEKIYEFKKQINSDEVTELKTQIVMISSRFAEIHKGKITGTITDSEYQLEKNKITKGVLEITNSLSQYHYFYKFINGEKEKEIDVNQTNKILPIFLLIDASGSMGGHPIQTINIGIANMITHLRFAETNNFTPAISIISYNSDVTIDLPLTRIDEIGKTPIINAYGTTNLGAALSELSKAIELTFSSKLFNCYSPIIMLMTDGFPTDEWEIGLEKLLNISEKLNIYCVAINDGNMNYLKEIGKTTTIELKEPDNFFEVFKWSIHNYKSDDEIDNKPGDFEI